MNQDVIKLFILSKLYQLILMVHYLYFMKKKKVNKDLMEEN